MGTRRKDPWEEIITALGGLICLGVLFVPGFTILLYFGAAIVLVGLAGFLIFALLKHKTVPSILDRPSAAEFFSPSITTPLRVESTLSEKLRRIDWFQFEKLVAAIYQSKGYRVTRL